MDSIRTNTSAKTLLINDGPDTLTFDPTDTYFAEKFYRLMQNLESREGEFLQRAEELDRAGNVEDSLAFLRDTCKFFRDEIDLLFGAGTSQKLFGEVYSLQNIGKFFKDITPYISAAREARVAKYTAAVAKPAAKSRQRHKAVK